MDDKRPKWLQVALAILIGWFAFWFSLIMLMSVIVAIFDLLIPGEGLPIWLGCTLTVICLTVSVIATAKFVRFQRRFLSSLSIKMNYMILAFVIFVTFVIGPSLFMVEVY